MKSEDREVVVTGMGCIAPNGLDVESFWKGLLSGKHAFSPVQGLKLEGYDRFVGGQAHAFTSIADGLRDLGRSQQMAVVAGRAALSDAGLSSRTEGWSFALGSALGSATELEEMNSAALATPGAPPAKSTFEKQLRSSWSAAIADALGVQVMSPYSLANACSSGNAAIALVASDIASGRASIGIAGGAESFSRIGFTAFVRLGAMAPERCQPFDRNRQGIIYSEGASILVLESLAHARARGARIHASVRGYGMTCDANHVAAPQGDGMVKALVKTLRHAKLAPEDVDYIGAHGTGTSANDITESRAILAAFGNAGKRIPVSSIKSMIGHTHGAASTHHVIAAILAIRDGVIPPTANLEAPDPDIEIDCVPNHARSVKVRNAVVASAGFGGNNACVAVGSAP